MIAPFWYLINAIKLQGPCLSLCKPINPNLLICSCKFIQEGMTGEHLQVHTRRYDGAKHVHCDQAICTKYTYNDGNEQEE